MVEQVAKQPDGCFVIGKALTEPAKRKTLQFLPKVGAPVIPSVPESTDLVLKAEGKRRNPWCTCFRLCILPFFSMLMLDRQVP